MAIARPQPLCHIFDAHTIPAIEAIMSKRTTINLTDDLVAAMLPFRGEMNVSKICNQALWNEVESRRIVQVHRASMRDAVARLRAQRLASDADHKKAGREAGATWTLGDATYHEIKWFIDEVGPRVEEGERAYDIVVKERPDMDPEQSDPLTALGEGRDPDEFWAGFLKAVIDVWGEIGDAVDGDENYPPRPDRR